MKIKDGVIKFKSISGFIGESDMVYVLNLYNKAPGITPPQFVYVNKGLYQGRTGYYFGMSTYLDDEDIEKLRTCVMDMTVDGH